MQSTNRPGQTHPRYDITLLTLREYREFTQFSIRRSIVFTKVPAIAVERIPLNNKTKLNWAVNNLSQQSYMTTRYDRTDYCTGTAFPSYRKSCGQHLTY
jgi:hypothetical protein